MYMQYFKAAVAGIFTFFSCTSSAAQPPETKCEQLGESFSLTDPESGEVLDGYLSGCDSSEHFTCCAYTFLYGPKNELCAHVVCSEDKCDWSYEGTYCDDSKPEEIEVRNETKDNAGDPWISPKRKA